MIVFDVHKGSKVRLLAIKTPTNYLIQDDSVGVGIINHVRPWVERSYRFCPTTRTIYNEQRYAERTEQQMNVCTMMMCMLNW